MIKRVIAGLFVFSLGIGVASAQSVPNPFSGMGRDSDKPIAIQADSTTADIRNETATYAGNVRIEQGNLRMRSDTLAIKATKGEISRIEAKGNVVLVSPQGQATGAAALYDISQRTVQMSGKVVLAQGQNVLRGTSLVINLATGRAQLTGAGPSGRVEGVFVPTKSPKPPSHPSTLPLPETKPNP